MKYPAVSSTQTSSSSLYKDHPPKPLFSLSQQRWNKTISLLVGKQRVPRTHSVYDIYFAIIGTFIVTLFFTSILMAQINDDTTTNTISSSSFNGDEQHQQDIGRSSSSFAAGVSSLFRTPLFNNFRRRTSVVIHKRDLEERILGLEAIDHNPLYRIPESMYTVGDRSDSYITLRQLYDTELLPRDYKRSLQNVRTMNEPSRYTNLGSYPITVHHSDTVPYNIYDCPETPPVGYPYAWNIMDVLTNWKPDDYHLVPNQIYQGLCIFDYNVDYDKAMNYRNAELPFVINNDPDVARTVERWNTPGYMEQMLGDVLHRTEYSENNHFMYWVPPANGRKGSKRLGGKIRGPIAPKGWKEPTRSLRMEYTEWLRHANSTTDPMGPDQPHWYYRLIGCGLMGNDGSCDKGGSEYLYDELPFFQPKESLYVVEPAEQKGIHCRFGMPGVIAENHFDHSRNSIVVLKGSRRYILADPKECDHLALYPKGHPSARHSATDWSKGTPNITEYPEFANAMVNEVVLQAGQVMYLPTDWFHYIVSLELNFQCNTRSGITYQFIPDLHRCGFF